MFSFLKIIEEPSLGESITKMSVLLVLFLILLLSVLLFLNLIFLSFGMSVSCSGNTDIQLSLRQLEQPSLNSLSLLLCCFVLFPQSFSLIHFSSS